VHFQRVHGDHAPERVFRSVVNASATVAIARGDVCLWDVVATLVDGTDTRGARVLRNVGTLASIRVAGVAENAGAITAAGQFRQDGFIMQVSGIHHEVNAEGTVTQDAMAIASNTAGLIETVAVPGTVTNDELEGRMGWFMEARTGAGPVAVMLKNLL